MWTFADELAVVLAQMPQRDKLSFNGPRSARILLEEEQEQEIKVQRS